MSEALSKDAAKQGWRRWARWIGTALLTPLVVGLLLWLITHLLSSSEESTKTAVQLFRPFVGGDLAQGIRVVKSAPGSCPSGAKP